MSRSVRGFQFFALGVLGAAALLGFSAAPAVADAAPVQIGEPCGPSAYRTSLGCRVVKRSGVVRTAMIEPRRTPFFLEPRETVLTGRYTSLLILGVGY